MLPLESGFQIGDIGIHFIVTNIFQRLHAVEYPRMMADGSSAAAVKILREFFHVASEDRRRFEIRTGLSFDEAAKSLLGVAREVRLAQFAIVDHVDAALDL